jgi:hypothetical protein
MQLAVAACLKAVINPSKVLKLGSKIYKLINSKKYIAFAKVKVLKVEIMNCTA